MEIKLPHEAVLVRLQVSPIAGIGVFATENIAIGTNLFGNDRGEIRWVSQAIIDSLELSDAQRSLYEDFAIRRDAKLGCPGNFNLLTVGWYCNEPVQGQAANARVSADFEIFAARDISAGEEVTIDYSSFSKASAPQAHSDGA